MKISDMPKLESPFIRKTNERGEYVVIPEINSDCVWVFEGNENDVLATEKLDGTDVSIVIENGIIASIWNRTARIPFFCKGKEHIVEGVMESFKRGYTELPDGQWFGEVIGEKLNGNPCKIQGHLWIPFTTYCREHLSYKSWHKYPKTFENISDWFRKPISEGGIFSLFMKKRGIDAKPEGIVFHNLKTGQMAKLRMDMFEWFSGRRHDTEAPREKERHEA
jgi:hypothetical protein